MVKQLSSGTSIALEIASGESAAAGDSADENATVTRFRELVGPSDPELARVARPNSLRARFGKSIDENAVHCTDLPEDGALEVEYFFKILQK